MIEFLLALLGRLLASQAHSGIRGISSYLLKKLRPKPELQLVFLNVPDIWIAERSMPPRDDFPNYSFATKCDYYISLNLLNYYTRYGFNLPPGVDVDPELDLTIFNPTSANIVLDSIAIHVDELMYLQYGMGGAGDLSASAVEVTEAVNADFQSISNQLESLDTELRESGLPSKQEILLPNEPISLRCPFDNPILVPSGVAFRIKLKLMSFNHVMPNHSICSLHLRTHKGTLELAKLYFFTGAILWAGLRKKR